MLSGLRRVVCVTASLGVVVGCGARTEFRAPAPTSDAGVTLDAVTIRDAASVDVANVDVRVFPDAGDHCTHFEYALEPTRVLGDDAGFAVGPVAIGRAGGFDLTGVVSGSTRSNVAVRVTFPDGGTPLIAMPVVLDSRNPSIGSAASDGRFLATCNTVSDRTNHRVLRTFGDDYSFRAEAAAPAALEICKGLAGHDDRWTVWSSRTAPPLETRAEMFTGTGMPVGASRVVRALDDGYFRGIGYANGVAWATPDYHRRTLLLTTWTDGGAPREETFDATFSNDSRIDLAPWPFDPRAVAIAWIEPAAGGARVHVRVQRDDGTVLFDAQLPDLILAGRTTPLLAAMDDALGVVAMERDSEFRATFHAVVIGADGAVRGPSLEFEDERIGLQIHDQFAAGEGDRMALMWTHADVPMHEDLRAAILRCVR